MSEPGKRKRYRSRARSRGPSTKRMALNRQLKMVVPKRIKRTLRYSDIGITLNPGVGSTATHSFNCNGLYDPDYTSTGHQPLGFDQYMALYNKYQVIGSKITVQVRSLDSSYTHIVGIYQSDSTSASIVMSRLMEQGKMKWDVLVPYSQNGHKVLTLTSNFSLKAVTEGSNLLGEDLLEGNSGTNPTRSFYYHIVAYGDGGNDTTGVYISNVTIDYITVFSDPIEVAQS